MASTAIPNTPQEWKQSLEELPEGGKIPAFFFAHGQPFLIWPSGDRMPPMGGITELQGPGGPLASFLKDFGQTLLKKYKPKGIIVFSAHFETSGERLVTDYGDENPLLMDYYGFQPALYQVKFKSRGDSALSQRVVSAFHKASMRARTTPITENRGRDGRGFSGPGLDHGVFVPFKLMFGDEFTDVPIVQVSIESDMSPERQWAVGKAVAELRSEGLLILSGGLGIHTFQDVDACSPTRARDIFKSFHRAILDAALVPTPQERHDALVALTSHPGFRPAHPREEHFVPIYIAAGAGEEGEARVLYGMHGGPTIAFGV
ncbi:hypothetical protein BOTBODRAFT_105172 [Botryobasidium botryosum FD-172 SS1]|uniref:Extradiol ring-cleavage dioxygenase class III enzyme subunit B domain-containing protein n=1 Tax=Botryobasidium botryosum (strain FD-172 SS1) TaxID=930990 RepID=A0A067N0G1_BOTB1|nr:hypothetical protein BOTBODRAFT_105172 [Botryobasidium botryosum FD-172 SS1]